MIHQRTNLVIWQKNMRKRDEMIFIQMKSTTVHVSNTLEIEWNFTRAFCFIPKFWKQSGTLFNNVSFHNSMQNLNAIVSIWNRKMKSLYCKCCFVHGFIRRHLENSTQNEIIYWLCLDPVKLWTKFTVAIFNRRLEGLSMI